MYLEKYNEAQNRDFQTADDKKYIREFDAIQAKRSGKYTLYFTDKGEPHVTKHGNPYCVVKFDGAYYQVFFRSVKNPDKAKVSKKLDIRIYPFNLSLYKDLHEYFVYILNDDIKNIQQYIDKEKERWNNKHEEGTTSRLTLQSLSSL